MDENQAMKSKELFVDLCNKTVEPSSNQTGLYRLMRINWTNLAEHYSLSDEYKALPITLTIPSLR